MSQAEQSKETTEIEETTYTVKKTDAVEKTNTDEPSESDDSIKLKLGDIIEIIAPSNPLLHQSHFFIQYINESRIQIINVATLEETQLTIYEGTGSFTDESITEILLVNRSPVAGYARQNNLLTGTWIEIHITSEISTIITGEITSLEEDQIEITTYPELSVIYIDFEYKGLPEDIPIKKITIRDKPEALKRIKSLGDLPESADNADDVSDPYMEYLETGEVIINAEETAETEENIITSLQSLVSKSKGIVYGEDLEDITQFIEIPESKKRYAIDAQINSMLDELLSTIPTAQRSKTVVDKINVLINRYRELRTVFSVFDENGNIRNFKKNDPNFHKPLVEHIKQMDTKLKWVLPVVNVKRKLYFDDDELQEDIINTDVEPIDFNTILTYEENLKHDIYYKNNAITEEGKYFNLYRQLTDLMRPFDNNHFENPNILAEVQVKTNIETIINNLDDFNASVMQIAEKQMNLVKRKYVIQTYNLGLNRLIQQKRGGKDAILSVPMGPADTMSVKSVILLPIPVMNYSRIDLPSTGILERANLHQSPIMLYRLLRSAKDIVPFIIDDLSKEIDYDSENSGVTGDEFLSHMRHYILSDNITGIDDSEKFEKFLRAIIPKTRTLIRLIRKYIQSKLTFIDIVRSLEPFMIYPEDISYKQYMEIRFFIIEEIKKRKESLDQNRKEFSSLINTKFDIKSESIFVIRALLEKNDLLELFLAGYKLPEKDILDKSASSLEVLDKIIKIDQGVLFSKLLSSLLSSLMMPDSMQHLFETEKDNGIDDMGKQEKIKAADCHRRVLTKRYTSISDLQKDNNTTEIYYDSEFDDTPYHILDKYKDDKKKMLPEKFVNFLAENLVQKHDCPRNRSIEFAKRLISGKKIVGDGEYAILEIKPRLSNKAEETSLSPEESANLEEEASVRAKTQYYYRKKDNWIHHADVDEQSFVDSSDMFCKLDKKCYSNKTPLSTECESMDESAIRMREIARKKIAKEFDRRYEESTTDMKSSLEKNIVSHIEYIRRLMRMRAVKEEKMNDYCYALGSLLSDTGELPVQSPHIELRDLILGQYDFAKKQQDIVKFYHAFCREPISDENNYWKYCKDTNAKLLPEFMYELAYSYISGDNYNLKLEEICHTHGLLSDSGNAIVDKHSGFTIRMIDYSNEEGFDESGFKISTHAFIEQDSSEKVVSKLLNQTNDVVCEGELSQMICNILASMASSIGISVDKIRDATVRVASSICDKLIVDESVYLKQAKKEEEKKGIRLPSYKKRSHQLRILIVAAVLFTVIQTQMPSFSVNKTMPGCVKSFTGYPLSGEEDVSGLKYFACILNKMKASYEPWDAIQKMTVDMITEQMKKIISSAVLKHPEIDGRYLLKHEYLLENPDQSIPEEHSIIKWTQFLPPIIDTNVISSGLKGVSSNFKDEFISLMKSGHKDQRKDLLVFKSKIARFSYAIIESIQKIVSNKDLLLSAMASGQPFLQNACCNENSKSHIPIQYFIQENGEIQQFIKTTNALSTIVDMVLDISKAQLLYDPRNSVLQYPPLSNDITETNIYAAFIHYCQLDKGQGIPSVFHHFLTEIPKGYQKEWTVEEKMECLKRANKKFDISQLHELMRIIQKRNMISMYETQKYNPVEIMKDMLSVFENHDSPIIEETLRDKLLAVLDKFDKTKLLTIQTESSSQKESNEDEKIATSKTLKNALARIIQNFKPQVLAYLKKYGKLGRTDFENLTTFFNTFITKWSSQDLYKRINFIKNTIDEMTQIFPNILLTNVSNNNRIHEYWGLSDLDKIKLYNSTNSYYEPLGEFRNDNVLKLLLTETKRKFVDLRLFFENCPIQTPIMRNGREYFSLFDNETTILLMEYIFLSVIHEYIIATDDKDLIRTDIFEKKRSNRERILENQDLSVKFQTEFTNMDEEFDETNEDMAEIQFDLGNTEELKVRVAKMLLAFINIMRKNKTEFDVSYDNIAAAIRKRKEKEKNRIVQRFERLNTDERQIENMKKKYKLDEWNVGMQKGLIVYDKLTSTRERMEQEKEDELDIAKHGIRKADFISIHADSEETFGEIIRQTEDNANEAEGAEEDETYQMGFGLDSLKSNFHDGQFYSDDESDDGFGEDS